MVLQSLLNGIKERNFRGIAKQTEKLDPQTRQHLQEYLHSSIIGSSNSSNNEDQQASSIQQELEELQEDLSQASSRLKELKEKEEFIGTRLQAYQTKLKSIDIRNNATDGDSNDESSSPTSKQQQEILVEKHQKALSQIQKVHDTMKHNIKVLQKKMQVMEKRKLELTWHLEECQVVLETANQLEQLETELAAEQAVAYSTDDTDLTTDGVVVEMTDLQLQEESDGTIPVHTTTSSKKEEATDEANDDDDEEVGKMESVVHDFEATDNVAEEEEDEDNDNDERIHRDDDDDDNNIEDGLASRIAIADDQV